MTTTDSNLDYRGVLERARKFRLLSIALIAFSILLGLATSVYVGLQSNTAREVTITDKDNALGSNLSHLSDLGGGWRYLLEVEEIILEKNSEGDIFGMTHLRQTHIKAFKDEGDEEILFYAPEALWDQKAEVFFLYGGCRIWQGTQMDISTEEVTIDLGNRIVSIDKTLTGRYGKDWFFEAAGAEWDIANDSFVFDGYIEFGKRAEEV